uniref:NADH-ubiquinone oxidoreductase chain 4L n=1 Tax=Arescus labiatus TaxID=294769 RepID=U3KZX6_9CUCU|nr:NADH dehydrogenase subunit 4L [Arescus labiatus]
MKIYYLLSIFMYLGGVMSFLLNRKHFLSLLLSLEFMMLALFLFLFFFIESSFFNLFFSMIYLLVVVCEGVLGLSLMVLMIRVSGSDMLMSFSFLW